MKTRVKKVLWYCVICKRTIDGLATDEVPVCRDSHVPIEMEPF